MNVERLGEILEKIDDISNRLIQNDNLAYNDILDITDDVGMALEQCAGKQDSLSAAGYNISEQDIFNMVEDYGMAISKKDNMMMVDILCFEIYPLLNTYKMILEG